MIDALLRDAIQQHLSAGRERYARIKDMPGQLDLFGAGKRRSTKVQASLKWDEKKHPRDADGKFAEHAGSKKPKKPASPKADRSGSKRTSENPDSRAEWTQHEGSLALRIPGSKFVAVAANGQKDAKNFAVYDTSSDSYDPVEYLPAGEVHGWLERNADDVPETDFGNTKPGEEINDAADTGNETVEDSGKADTDSGAGSDADEAVAEDPDDGNAEAEGDAAIDIDALKELGVEELNDAIWNTKNRFNPKFYTEDWGSRPRGQGKRSGGMIMGAMSSPPTGKKRYIDDLFAEVPGLSADEKGELKDLSSGPMGDQFGLGYLKARSAGLNHEEAALFGVGWTDGDGAQLLHDHWHSNSPAVDAAEPEAAPSDNDDSKWSQRDDESRGDFVKRRDAQLREGRVSAMRSPNSEEVSAIRSQVKKIVPGASVKMTSTKRKSLEIYSPYDNPFTPDQGNSIRAVLRSFNAAYGITGERFEPVDYHATSIGNIMIASEQPNAPETPEGSTDEDGLLPESADEPQADAPDELPAFAAAAGIRSWEDARKKGVEPLLREAGDVTRQAARDVATRIVNHDAMANELASMWVWQTYIAGNRTRGAREAADSFEDMSARHNGETIDSDMRRMRGIFAQAFLDRANGSTDEEPVAQSDALEDFNNKVGDPDGILTDDDRVPGSFDDSTDEEPEPDSKEQSSLFSPPETRDEAKAATEREFDENYAFARKSAVANAGEDLLDSARHKRNEWQGLEEAEADGTAEALVTRDNLFKAEPHDLVSIAEENPENALTAAVMALALRKLPAKPGPKDKRSAARLDSEAKRRDRQQFVEMYRHLKQVAEDQAKSESDPVKAVDAFNDAVVKQVNSLRQIEPGGSRYSGKDRYNNTANLLVDTHKAMGSARWDSRKTSIHNQLKDIQRRLSESSDHDTTSIAMAIAEGAGVDKAFGVKGESKRSFDPAQFYGHNETIREGGRTIAVGGDANKATKHLIGDAGLRGVQFGNSVTDQEREHHALKAAEALADLADMTGLDDRDISIDGKLGLAIGARGRAGALAHYEPDSKVINLTRKGGIGSLAHEWGHFFDHAMGEFGGFKSDNFHRTSRVEWRDGKYHHEQYSDEHGIHAAYKGLYEAMAPFKKRLDAHLNLLESRKQMSGKKVNYWASKVETFARCFERHVQDKLEKEGRSNGYLVSLRKKSNDVTNLWPTEEETAAMAPHFEAIFDAFKKRKASNADKYSMVAMMNAAFARERYARQKKRFDLTEQYARKKSMPGQMSMFGGTNSRSGAKQATLKWEESKHPRAADGRFGDKAGQHDKKQDTPQDDAAESLGSLKKKRQQISDQHIWNNAMSKGATRPAPPDASDLDSKIRDAKEKEGKAHWQRTRDQVKGALAMPEAAHRKIVKAAIDAGKDVPANVLADYPDLQPSSQDIQAGHKFTAHENVPMGANEYTVKSIEDGKATVTDGRFTQSMPADSLSHFVNDMQGRVSVAGQTGNASVDAVLSGKAKFLGKGDDGLVFDAGDGNAVKVSTTVPYIWSNFFHRSPTEAAAEFTKQIQTGNAMADAGIPGIMRQEMIEHGGKVFAVRPMVDIPDKLTPDQLEQTRQSIKAMHDAGYSVNDQIQVGIGADGKVYQFDTGKASKFSTGGNAARWAVEDDMNSLGRIYEANGQTMERPMSAEAALDQYEKLVHKALKDKEAGEPIMPGLAKRRLQKLQEGYETLSKLDPLLGDYFEDMHPEAVAYLSQHLKKETAAPAPLPAGTQAIQQHVAGWTPDQKIADWDANGVTGAAFKNWFGDWENDFANSSKVVDENREPQATMPTSGKASQVKGEDGKPIAVYHGTGGGSFEAFEKRWGEATGGGNEDNLLYGPGIYTTEDEGVATEYSQIKSKRFNGDVNGFVASLRKSADTLKNAWSASVREDGDKLAKAADAIESGDHDPNSTDGEHASAIKMSTPVSVLDEFFPDASDPHLFKVYVNIRNPWDADSGVPDSIIEGLNPEQRSQATKSLRSWRAKADRNEKNYQEQSASLAMLEKEQKHYQENGDREGMLSYLKTAIPETRAAMERNRAEHKNIMSHVNRGINYSQVASVVGGKAQLNKMLQDAGYDGITHIGGSLMGGGHNHRVWIAFEPNQIKSTDNRGTFDASDDRMKYSRDRYAGLFDEAKHPRDHGKFASKPGSGVAGQQMGLFHGDEQPGQQKTLFNVVKPKASSKKQIAAKIQASLLERIEDDLKKKAADAKPLAGQKDLFSRSRSDMTRFLMDQYGVDRYELAPQRQPQPQVRPTQRTERPKQVAASEKQKRQPGDGTPGWQKVGGSHVFVNGDGKITKGCPGLKGEYVSDIIDESDDSRDVREVRQAHAKAEGLTGEEYTAKDRRRHQTKQAQEQHANAKEAAKQHGVATHKVLATMPEAHGIHSGQNADIEAARKRARQMTGLNSGRIAKIENNYRDHSTVPGFELAARDFAAERPDLFDKDDHDTPAKVWDFIREGEQDQGSARSLDTAHAAAELIRNRLKPMMQASDPVDDGGTWDESEFEDDSFDFGQPSTRESLTATLEAALASDDAPF